MSLKAYRRASLLDKLEAQAAEAAQAALGAEKVGDKQPKKRKANGKK